MKTPTLIASAPADILLGLAILLAAAGLILFVLAFEDEIRRLPAKIAGRLRGRRRWLFIPGAGETLAEGESHDYVV